MNALVIADTAIRTDEQGRFCLNDLHRAAGAESKHQPANWLRTQQTQDLAAELEVEIPQIRGIESKQGLGTFVVKELVYAYAMWISAAFHLKVIRAYDAMVTAPPVADPMKVLNDPAAMRGLLLTYSEKVLTLEGKVAEQAPKVQALELLRESDGALCLTDAAKVLEIQRDKFIRWVYSIGWIYRRQANNQWTAHADKERAGYVVVKLTPYQNSKGETEYSHQVRITPKGMAKLALLKSQPNEAA